MLKTWVFPAGEVGVKIEADLSEVGVVNIVSHQCCSDDFMALAMFCDAARRMNPGIIINAVMPYIPYGRQDRVCGVGESASIEVFASLLNLLNLNLIVTLDPHSAKTVECIKNLKVINQWDIVGQVFDHSQFEDFVVVAPDAGAVEKSKKCAEVFGIEYAGSCNKVRDPETGYVTQYTTDFNVAGRKVIVFDDICDGGATFKLVAAALRASGATTVELYVTHGIFSKGVEALTSVFDKVYTTNSYRHPEGYDNLVVFDADDIVTGTNK